MQLAQSKAVCNKSLQELLSDAAEQVFSQIMGKQKTYDNLYHQDEDKHQKSLTHFQKCILQISEKQLEYSQLYGIAKRCQKHRIPLVKLLKSSMIQDIFSAHFGPLQIKSPQTYKIRILRNSIQQKSHVLWATHQYVRLIEYNYFYLFSKTHCNARKLLCYVEGLKEQSISYCNLLIMLGLVSKEEFLTELTDTSNPEFLLVDLYGVSFTEIKEEELEEVQGQGREEQGVRTRQLRNRMRSQSKQQRIISSAWVYYLLPHKKTPKRRSLESTVEQLMKNRQRLEKVHKIKIMSEKQYIESQIKTQKLKKTTNKFEINPYIAHQIPESKIQEFNSLIQFENEDFFSH